MRQLSILVFISKDFGSQIPTYLDERRKTNCYGNVYKIQNLFVFLLVKSEQQVHLLSNQGRRERSEGEGGRERCNRANNTIISSPRQLTSSNFASASFAVKTGVDPAISQESLT